MSGRRLTTPLACLAVAALAALALVTVANGRGSGTVALCAAGDSGGLTAAKNGKCGPGARKIAFAKQGPRGKTGAPGPAGPAGPAGADASAAVLAPESVRFVQPPPGPEMACATSHGTFCSYSAVAFGNEGGAFAKVGFSKDSSGFVHLQGVTKWVCNNACNGAAYGDTIFYLPPGYAPTGGKREFAIGRCVNSGTGEETGEVRTVQITTDGAVTLSSAGCTPDSLDGISFYP